MEGNDSGSSLINTGTTDNVKGSSGFVTSGSTPMAYRGIENLYGNLAMWTDGLNISNLSLYSCDDATKYASDVFTSPYYMLNYSLQSMTSGNSNITGLGFDKDHPSVEAPASSNNDQYNTYYHDYCYVNGSGNYVVDTGGSWDWGAGNSGLWCWDGNGSSTTASSDVALASLRRLCKGDWGISPPGLLGLLMQAAGIGTLATPVFGTGTATTLRLTRTPMSALAPY